MLRKFRVVFPLLLGATMLFALGFLSFSSPNTAAADVTADFPVIADFEDGAPADWFTYNGGASSVGAVFANGVLTATFNQADFAGFGALLPSQDWSDYNVVTFDFYGTNSGLTYSFEAQDGTGAVVERFQATWVDDTAGWQTVSLPIDSFFRGGFQDGGAPDDGFQLTSIAAWVVVLPTGADTIVMDNLALQRVPVFPEIALFENGAPADWFTYNGGASSVAPVFGNGVVTVTYSQADFGGFGALLPSQDWSDYDAVIFDFYGTNSGATYTFEAQDASGGGTVERFQATWVDDVAGWQTVILPLDSFFRGGFQEGGAPDDGFQLTAIAAWVFVLPGGADMLALDNLAVTNLSGFEDYDAGAPAGWFAYNGGASSVAPSFVTIGDTSPYAAPGQVGDNGILSGTFSIGDFGGFGVEYATSLDWTDGDGIAYWFYGRNSGLVYTFEIQDGTPGLGVDRYHGTFTDNFDGWKLIVLPFDSFFYGGFQDNPPNDGLNLNDVRAWAYPLPGGAGSFMIDGMFVYGDAGNIMPRVSFDSAAYDVTEGDMLTATVSLNTMLSEAVTVTYGTTDGTADSSDYTSASGMLVFAAGETEKQVVVSTTQDEDLEDDETFTLALSDPSGADLGTNASATVTIVDDEEEPAANPSKAVVIEDFEYEMLPSGTITPGETAIEVGFLTFNAPAASASVSVTMSPPADVPGAAAGNTVMAADLTVTNGEWAGFTSAFTNDELDAWETQDWSNYEGIGMWIYGHNTGGVIFIDVLDNRAPGSTVDDAERYSIDLTDDFTGWQYFELMFDDMNRKEVGNGAPNDDFNLTEVHGFAVGVFGSVDMGNNIYYIDDVGLLQRTTVIDDYETDVLFNTTITPGTEGIQIGFLTFNAPTAGVAITTTDSPVEQPPGAVAGNRVMQANMTIPPGQWAGYTHAFENEAGDAWEPQDWSTYEGICFWLYGHNTGGVLFFDLIDNRTPGSTTDDAERYSVDIADDFSGWQFIQIPFSELNRKEIGNGAPNDGLNLTEVHGYAIGGFGSVDMGTNDYLIDDVTVYGNTGGGDVDLEAEFTDVEVEVMEGYTATVEISLNVTATEDVTVTYMSSISYATPDRDYYAVSGDLVIPAGSTAATFDVMTIDDAKDEPDENIQLIITNIDGAAAGFAQSAVLTIVDNDATDPNMLDDFEGWHPFEDITGTVSLDITEITAGDMMELPGQGMWEQVLSVTYTDGSIRHNYGESQDWSAADGIKFWYYGSNSGNDITYSIFDNPASTTGDVDPNDWVMVWNEEYNGAAGTMPDDNIWSYELGDGQLNGLVGWGNSESQFYTDSSDNVAQDGNGNLVITLDAADDSSLQCWYGQCNHTSARLVTEDKFEFAYGRVETRILVPDGGAGLWPAFWMLGSDIDQVGWPQSGEIDIMEYVSRLPNEIFGTIHGPGYAGGASYGNIYDFGSPVAADYHTFTIDWQPDLITWYVDGIQYHTAEPANVAPNEWVYNHSFYLIMNLAIGGNFGGSIDENNTYPQEMLVDYVRVYGAADSAEQFDASFTDDFEGWKQITLPFDAFSRSADQPADAPDDGLTLTEVAGYGFSFAGGSDTVAHIDQVMSFNYTNLYLPLVGQDGFAPSSAPGMRVH